MTTPNTVDDSNEPSHTTDSDLFDPSNSSQQPPGSEPNTTPITTTNPDPYRPDNTSDSPCETDLSWNLLSPVSPEQQPTAELSVDENACNAQRNEADAELWRSNLVTSNCDELSQFVLQSSDFTPYVRIYIERLYSVFPVVDRETLLSLLSPESQHPQIPVWLYAFLSALSAAVVVQLNITDLEASGTGLLDENTDGDRPWSIPCFSAQFFISQCMQARQKHDFIEEADEWTILTSFFLFVSHDNLGQTKSASYYLREAIGFVEVLGLGEPESYMGLDPNTEGRRKRLFWLLFVTERAYAVQHRRRATLRPTIDPPPIFECQDPRLAYGFASLVKVFATIDEPFITARMHEQDNGDVGKSPNADQSIAKLLDHSEVADVLSISEIDETQRLDIMITQHWIRILACQMQMASSLRLDSLKTRYTGTLGSHIHRALDTSRSLLGLISSATPASLECHGLGMERKVADAANCLCDVIATIDSKDFYASFFTAPEYLHSFMVFLANFRRRESQCLQPVAQRATVVLAARLEPMNVLAVQTEEVDLLRKKTYKEAEL
ncbi:hypothetical protein NM208_g2065 [Fusarium decemcellulare]|uniref:Uncharacterized protein n=1 Tax=Fusarium decemcellulare TaxID=57161 RepID=A0ACC1STP6_9HYPO|nr:hypothetical protein NM208_g2065 [Fusarium decemcellulare]